MLGLGLAGCAVRGKRAALAELRLRVDAEDEGSRLLANNRELARQRMAVQESERRGWPPSSRLAAAPRTA